MLGTKKSNNLNCVVCNQVFEKGQKSYGRTNVFTKVPKKDYTPSEAFKLLGVSVSPIQVKDKYCCSKCTSIVRDYFGAHLNLTETKAKLLEGVKANSYIGGKLVLGNSNIFNTKERTETTTVYLTITNQMQKCKYKGEVTNSSIQNLLQTVKTKG